MRVSFRWSGGIALATKLDRSRRLRRPGARPAPGPGPWLVTRVRPRRPAPERRSRSPSPRRRGWPRHPRPSVARCRRSSAATGCGSGAQPLRGRRRARPIVEPGPLGRRLHRLHQELGRRRQPPLGQFSPELVAGAEGAGHLRARVAVRLRQRPGRRGRARRRRDRRRRRLPRRSTPRAPYENKYAQAAAVHGRAAGGGRPRLPDRLRPPSRTSTTTAGSRTRCFLAPGAATRTSRRSTGRTSADDGRCGLGRTLAHNRIYGTPIAPIGQTYGSVPPPRTSPASARCGRRTASAGLSWWSWQATTEAELGVARAAASAVRGPPRRPSRAGRRWTKGKTRATRVSGCSSRTWRPRCRSPCRGRSTRATERGAAGRSRPSRGLPVTGTTDAR